MCSTLEGPRAGSFWNNDMIPTNFRREVHNLLPVPPFVRSSLCDIMDGVFGTIMISIIFRKGRYIIGYLYLVVRSSLRDFMQGVFWGQLYDFNQFPKGVHNWLLVPLCVF